MAVKDINKMEKQEIMKRLISERLTLPDLEYLQLLEDLEYWAVVEYIELNK